LASTATKANLPTFDLPAPGVVSFNIVSVKLKKRVPSSSQGLGEQAEYGKNTVYEG